jgi:putative hemolysin
MLSLAAGESLLERSWQLALMALLLVCSAGFSAAETALFSLSRADLYNLGHDPRRLNRLVPALMRNPADVLATVLLGNNLVNILYFVNSALLVLWAETNLVGGQWWAWGLAAATLLAVVLAGEVIPKAVAFVFPRRLAPPAAAVLAVLARGVRPLQRVLMLVVVEPLTRLLAPTRRHGGGLSAEELASLLALSQRRGLIGQDESQLLQEVLELTDRRAADIMVPRVDMVAYPEDGSQEGLLDLARRTRITKVPVYQRDLDHVVGVLFVKRLLAQPQEDFRRLLEPVQFVPATASLERVLLQFRATRSQLAIVVDEYGGTAGLISLEAVLEEIVGDIADAREVQPAPAVRQVAPAEWLVDGDLPVHEWAEAFPTDLGGARFTTVGGFVVSLLGRLPRPGQTVRYRNVTFTVEGMRGRRVARLRVRLEEGQP